MSHSNNSGKLTMAFSMFVFGTIGLFVSKISFPSSFISFARALIASVFIICFMLVKKQKIDGRLIVKNLKFLIPSGVAMGFNWICLFEAYKYAGIPVATLCYYMAPVIMVLFSPIILKEKLTVTKAITSVAAIIGAVLISGVTSGEIRSPKGIALGLSAAVMYAGVVFMNKFIKGLSPVETTLIQFITAIVVIAPYILLTEDVHTFEFNPRNVLLTLFVGIFHTGIMYILYFSSVRKIPTQATAVFSYIDPVTAIILSAIILGERLSLVQIAGTILILGATLSNEIIPILNKNRSVRRDS